MQGLHKSTNLHPDNNKSQNDGLEFRIIRVFAMLF